MVLLKTILIVILLYYGFKFLWKWLAPKMLNYAVKKTSEKFGQQFGTYEDSYGQQQSEGETTVDKKPFQRKSNPSKKVGEYIDFEEID